MRADRRSLLLASSVGAGLLSLGAFGLWAKNLGRAAVPTPYDTIFPILAIGMNLAGIADWEPGFPFKNLFWGARPWLSRNLRGASPFRPGAQAAFEFDNNGYPLEVPLLAAGLHVAQVIFTLVPNVRTAGSYNLLYDGQGEIDGFLSTQVIRRPAGRLIVQMAQKSDGNHEGVFIKKPKREDHIRNIRLVAEEHADDDLSASPFLREFSNFCRPSHCLRFMDWGQTNNSNQDLWNDRERRSFYTMVAVSSDPEGKWGPPPTPFDQVFAEGVAYEMMIQLCNKLKTDMWVCIPCRATDDYIAQMATLVKQTLDPSLKFYLECSNEIWNWQFHQAGWMLQSPLAGALVEANGGFLWKNADRTEGKDHPERIGALSRCAFAIWEREWAGECDKLIRVCAVQVGWLDVGQKTISWCVDHGGADVISPTAYFGPSEKHYEKRAAFGSELTVDIVIEDMFDSHRDQRRGGNLGQVVAFEKANNLPYVAYEEVQHIQPEKQAELPYNGALAVAQIHPRMSDLNRELIRIQRDLGCQMLPHFSDVGKRGTRWGSWGAKAKYSDPDVQSPKMKTLLECNAQREQLGGGTDQRKSIAYVSHEKAAL